MNDELWTLEQLPERVAELLADDYDGQTNGRVRDLPNGRTIRWYTTIGLVDRPVGTRGRSAVYGPRHLLQLAAVKRLQSAGQTLAQIQEQIVGATNDQLADLAKVPRIDVVWPTRPIRADAFWRTAHSSDTSKADSVADSKAPDLVTPLHAIRLGDSVTVTLDSAPRAPDADELAAIATAAAPLLDLLGRLGLAPPPRKDSP